MQVQTDYRYNINFHQIKQTKIPIQAKDRCVVKLSREKLSHKLQHEMIACC